MDAQQRKNSVAWLSVISNTALVLGKLIIGTLIGSVSVISEAIHSGVDLVAAVIALFAVKTSNKVADDEHPFGHGKVENISGTVEAILIFLAAGWIIYEAVRRLVVPARIEAVGWGVGIMLVSSVVNNIEPLYFLSFQSLPLEHTSPSLLLVFLEEEFSFQSQHVWVHKRLTEKRRLIKKFSTFRFILLGRMVKNNETT